MGTIPHAIHCVPHNLDQFLWCPSVALISVDTEGLGPELDLAREGFGLIGTLGIAVVLQDDEQRQVPLRGDVHRLVDNTLAQSAITNENGDDVTSGRIFLR